MSEINSGGANFCVWLTSAVDRVMHVYTFPQAINTRPQVHHNIVPKLRKRAGSSFLMIAKFLHDLPYGDRRNYTVWCSLWDAKLQVTENETDCLRQDSQLIVNCTEKQEYSIEFVALFIVKPSGAYAPTGFHEVISTCESNRRSLPGLQRMKGNCVAIYLAVNIFNPSCLRLPWWYKLWTGIR